MVDGSCACAPQSGLTAPRALPPLRHAFTHFQLEARPLLFDGARARDAVCDQPAHGWYLPQAALALALPAPVRRLLQQLPEIHP